MIVSLVWVVVLTALLILPLRILRSGYLPPDDALRHAARAVSGKSWQEILIMRPEITVDHNPGWNFILEWIHRRTGWTPTTLVQLSVVALFIAFALSPFVRLKRPEAWLLAITGVMVIFPYFAARAFVGRPLLLTMGVTLILLSIWTRLDKTVPGKTLLLLSSALVALAVWVHGSWYLLVLVPVVFALAQQWHKAFLLFLCWFVGCLVGALPTLQPWAFLSQTLLIPFAALSPSAPVQSLVGEFQPFTGGYPAAILVAVVLLGRRLFKLPQGSPWHDPVLWMAALGFVLGFHVLRFWLDWGLPALALWLARQIEEFLQLKTSQTSWLRLAYSSLFAVLLIGAVGADHEGRWTQTGNFEALDAARAEQAPWLPDPGGVLYSVDLSVFYETFFRNPHGPWRYVLGFEPSFMRPDDLAVYQELWRTLNAMKATAPWVQRMTPADRLVLHASPKTRPNIPGLQWHYVVKETWVGRREWPGR